MLAVLLLVPCGYSGGDVLPPAEAYRTLLGQLRDGDLVFRRGRSFVSRVVISSDPAREYSHVGIVVTRNGVPLVVHAAPAEGNENPGVTIAEPLLHFVAPQQASAWAVYRTRPGLEAVAAAAALHAAAYERAATPFDGTFDLDTSDKVYCTELVWRSYVEAGLDLVESRREHLRMALFERTVIVPGSISASRHLVQVVRSHYGENR